MCEINFTAKKPLPRAYPAIEDNSLGAHLKRKRLKQDWSRKRTYLTNHSLSEQSPYYWSSFILIGDAGTIDLSSNWSLYLIAGILILLGILFFRKKTKSVG